MKLVIIFGPQAVGKMTVGHELEKITDLKLFHNHMTIELVSPFFNYSTSEGKRLVRLFREEIFKAVAKSDLVGLIFTYIWELDSQSDWDYINKLAALFREHGADVCFVELEAHLRERIERNKTEHRLLHKPTKRDIAWSESQLLNTNEDTRMNSQPGEISDPNYIRIDNTHLSPTEVANIIKDHFGL
jgi:AAA domain